MAKQTYLKVFGSEDQAEGVMRTKNHTSRDGTLFVLFDGPTDGSFAVADLRTAVEMDALYRWGF